MVLRKIGKAFYLAKLELAAFQWLKFVSVRVGIRFNHSHALPCGLQKNLAVKG